MLEVTVRFLGEFRSVTRTSAVTLTVPVGATVSDLAQELVARYGEAFAGRLWAAGGGLAPSCKVFLGHRELAAADFAEAVAPASQFDFLFVQAIMGGGQRNGGS